MIRLVGGSGRIKWESSPVTHGVKSGSSYSTYYFNHNQGRILNDMKLQNSDYPGTFYGDTPTGYNPSTGGWQRWWNHSVTLNSVGISAGRLSGSTINIQVIIYFDPD